MVKNISELSLKKIVNNFFISFGFYKILSRIQKHFIFLGLEEWKPRFSNYPFLSGDSFLMISDIAYIEKFKRPIKLRQKAQICFIEVSIFNSINDLKILYGFKKIIIHNGDEVPNMAYINLLVKKKIYIYASNILSKSKYVFPIPIGLENLYLRRNGSMHHFNPLKISNILIRKDKVLLSSFSISTNPSIREKLTKQLFKYGYENKFYSIKQYRKELARSYFVISPPGNGYDCHRTWEAVYFKTIPVVLKDYFGFEDLDLPILVVESFEQFLLLSENAKLEKYYELINKSNDQVYMDWWINLIRS